MSRVSFRDALLLRPKEWKGAQLVLLPRAFAPRIQQGRRVYDAVGVNLPQEVPTLVVPPGQIFRFNLGMVNLREEELGAILVALGQDGSFLPRWGGGKFAGLGRVRVTVSGARIRRGYRNPLPELLDANAAKRLVEACVTVALPLCHPPTLEKLRQTQREVRK